MRRVCRSREEVELVKWAEAIRFEIYRAAHLIHSASFSDVVRMARALGLDVPAGADALCAEAAPKKKRRT